MWAHVGRKSLTAAAYRDGICQGLLKRCDGGKMSPELVWIKLNQMKSCHQKCIFSSISQCRQYQSAITERPCGICPSFQENQRGVLFWRVFLELFSPDCYVFWFFFVGFFFFSALLFLLCVALWIKLFTSAHSKISSINNTFFLFFVYMRTVCLVTLCLYMNLFLPPCSAVAAVWIWDTARVRQQPAITWEVNPQKGQ